MTVKSIIDIELNDNAFVKFYDDFKKYQKDVSGLSKQWADVMKVIGGGKGGASGGEGGVAGATEDAAGGIGKMAAAAGELGAALTGVLAAVAAIGVATVEAAAKIAQARRDAQGLGMTIGQHNALNVNLTPYTDAASFMSGVSHAQADLGQMGRFAALGINPGEVAQLGTADLSVEVLNRIRTVMRQHPSAVGLQQWMDARGISQFVSLEQARSIAGMTDEQIANFNKNTRAGADPNLMGLTAEEGVSAQNATLDKNRALAGAAVGAGRLLAEPIRGLGAAGRAAVGAETAILSGGRDWESGDMGRAAASAVNAGISAAKRFASAVGGEVQPAMEHARKAATEAARQTEAFGKAGVRVATDLYNALKLFEGTRLRSYQDSNGLWTIGIGHHDASVHAGQTETETEAQAQFAQDIAGARADILKHLPWLKDAGKARQDAFAELDFNMGWGTLSKFHRMIAAAQAGDWHGAAEDYLESRAARQVHGFRAKTVADWMDRDQETILVVDAGQGGAQRRTNQRPAHVKITIHTPAGTNANVAANGAANVN